MSNLPDAVVARIRRGEHPIAAMRTWRGMTVAQLAAVTELDVALIEGAEAGLVILNERALLAITGALNVRTADLARGADDGRDLTEDDIPW